jgi:hypothetical protein
MLKRREVGWYEMRVDMAGANPSECNPIGETHGLEFCGRKGRAVAEGRRASGFLRQAQDRLFALARRAQDDSKNRQRIEQATAKY